MTIEELAAKANEGEVDSMIELMNCYIERKEWNEATDWADKAAEAGNTNGIYFMICAIAVATQPHG